MSDPLTYVAAIGLMSIDKSRLVQQRSGSNVNHPKTTTSRVAQASMFFTMRRVFELRRHASDAEYDVNILSKEPSCPSRYDMPIYTHIQRMAVRGSHDNCWSIPINTYKSHGIAKKLVASEISVDSTQPQPQPQPLMMSPDDDDDDNTIGFHREAQAAISQQCVITTSSPAKECKPQNCINSGHSCCIFSVARESTASQAHKSTPKQRSRSWNDSSVVDFWRAVITRTCGQTQHLNFVPPNAGACDFISGTEMERDSLQVYVVDPA